MIPAAEDAAQALVRDIAARKGLDVQMGKMMAELKLPGDKGLAVSNFVARPEIAGAAPWFIGDDLTDEAAFVACDKAGGAGILVGDRQPSAARYALRDVRAVRSWLAGLVEGEA